VGRARPQARSRLAALRRFYVVRHAKAGDREAWTADDRKRPLTKKGFAQADALVDLLAREHLAAVFSSPFLRCVQTVEPLARARKLAVRLSPSLEEGNGIEGLEEFFVDRSLDGAVLSTHGDIMEELLEDLMNREVIQPGYGGADKGATWVLGVDEHGVAERARYIPAP
jgi:8-oxo-dGTP diphosphatase